MAQALMVVLDNSAFMINGDYKPTRWDGQIDAAGILLASRSQSNAENAVGLATMAGRSVQVLSTPTTDNARVSACLAQAKISGQIHFVQALKICALVLKNRQNTVLRQRIFLFLGSTIRQSVQQLKIIGRKLNKSQIAVTIGAFGDLTPEQQQKLTAFIQTVNQQDNSSVTYIEQGSNICDKLLAAPGFVGGGGEAGGFPAGGDTEDEMLQIALKQSLEEEEERKRRKKEEEDKEKAGGDGKAVVEKPKEVQKDQYELSEKQAQHLAEQLSKQQPQPLNPPTSTNPSNDPTDQPDQKQKKKDKQADTKTIASQNYEPSQKFDQATIRGPNDFLTERADPAKVAANYATIKDKTETNKFMKDLESLAQDDSDEELTGKKKEEEEKKKKEKKKKEEEEEEEEKKKEE